MKNTTETSALSLLANDAGYDPLEDRLRENIRSTIEAVFEEELAQFLGRCRYGREDALRQGYRNGHRERQLTGTFGTERVSVPRARIVEEDGRASEWRSRALTRYQRLTRKAEALIASVYLSGTNTRRVKRALFGLFRGAVSKDVVSRAWRKVKVDWDAWCSRGLADEDIVRLILDGTVIKTRLDRKATNISVLAAIGVRRDGQKVLLSIGNMGGESQAAWRQFLDDLDARGLKRPGFVIVDGAPGLEAALSALWGDDLPVQRCTVHKHRNLLGHAPKHMHDELSEDYREPLMHDDPVTPDVALEGLTEQDVLVLSLTGARPMERFPKSLISFQRMFPDEAACAAWLFSMRWPEGFQCPGCGHDHGWALRAKAHTFECTSCHRQTSVTAGTILHGSKLDLTVWFWAAYLMATHSNGISALQLQKQLALGSYRTAWMLAAKLRRAMVDPDRNPLSGLVEIDETSLPFRTKNDPASGGPGRSHDGKLLVVGGIEVGDGNKPGRLRLAALTDYGAGSLNAFIARNIAPASTAKTDGWAGYAGVPVDQHDPHVIGAMAAHLVLPWIHQMFSNLKGWARGVYHGLRRKYLQTYLDEFVFRFNRRRTRHPTFRSMFAIAIRTKPVTYNMLVAPEQSA